MKIEIDGLSPCVTCRCPAGENQERSPVVPWNLTDWHDAMLLRHWVVQEVDWIMWDRPDPDAAICANRSKALLRLLTFSYITGLFESEEIVHACWRDLNYRSLCEGDIPTAKVIGRYRKTHRSLLKWTLVRVMSRAWPARFEEDNQPLPAGFRKYLVDTAVERLDLARHADRESLGA